MTLTSAGPDVRDPAPGGTAVPGADLTDVDLPGSDLPEVDLPDVDGEAGDAVGEDDDPGAGVALFEGDEGRLELAQRRAFVALLKHRFITARTHPAEWRTLVRHAALLRSRLNDLFLDLQLDRQREVAFKRQAVPDGGTRFPTLLFDKAWSREETILMVYLRSRSRAEEADGSTRVYVDREEMLEHVASLRPAHATDRSGDSRRAGNAVDGLNRAGLLIGARDADRFEISPAIDVVLPLERLQELLCWLRTQNAPAADQQPALPDGGDPDGADADGGDPDGADLDGGDPDGGDPDGEQE